MTPPADSVGEGLESRHARWIIFATVAAGFALRVLLGVRSAVINTDGPMFLSIAEGFLSGDASAATRAGFHPLYPALVALLGGSESVAVAVSAIAGAVAGVPLWRLARDQAGPPAGFLALVVYELHPAFIDVQSSVFADGVFMLWAAMAASGAIRFARGGGGPWTAAIGAGLAFLTKSEGLIVVLLTLGTLGIGFARRPRSRKAWLEIAGAGALMAAIAAPYVVHLSAQAGRFRYSPKSVVEMAVGTMPAGEGGIGKWKERRERHGPLVTSVWYTTHATTNAAGPVHLLLLVAAAVTWRAWRKRFVGQGWLALWILFYVACVGWANFRAGHQVSERYVHPPLALALLFLGPFAAWALERKEGEVRAGAARLLVASLIVVAVVEVVHGVRQDQAVYRRAGEWILTAHGPGAVVCSTVDKVPYYARGRGKSFQTHPPDADFWVFTDKDAEKWEWNWRVAPLGPFRHRITLPDPPEPGSRIVHILERVKSPR